MTKEEYEVLQSDILQSGKTGKDFLDEVGLELGLLERKGFGQEKQRKAYFEGAYLLFFYRDRKFTFQLKM